jgi:hypothetical protein
MLFAAIVMVALGTVVAKADEHVGNFILIPSLPDVIVLDGEITANTVSDFHRALAERPGVKVLVLDSGGGYVDPALALAAEIRQRGMATVIPPGFMCYSACSYLFFAGRDRVVRGKLGVHALSEDGVRTTTPVYDADVRAALTKYGASPAVLKAMASTPSSDIHVFSNKEIASWSINRGGGLATKYATQMDISDFAN